MLKKPKPKKLSAEEIATITESSSHQTGRVQTQKTFDPDYPVFDIPVNQKLLVYVPNHTLMQPDGSINLRWDKFAAHPIIDGRTYGNVRCTQGIRVDSLGLDGSCPLCDAGSEIWDLYHKEYEAISKAKGIPTDSPEAKEGLKEDRRKLAQDMVIKQAEVWLTFPIVVIECEEKDGQLTTIPKKTADGQIVGKPCFYSIREKTYNDKWVPAFETVDGDEVPTHPGGRWVILNFTYTPQSGQHTKMGSANALKIGFKNMGEDYKSWETHFDNMTADWTPEKAQEVVVLDVIRDMEETQEIADQLLKPVRDKLAIYNLNGGVSSPTAPAIGAQGDAQEALANFGATPVEGGMPPEALNEQNSGVE